jgi:hypothetical protein
MRKDRLESVPLETVDDGQVPCSRQARSAAIVILMKLKKKTNFDFFLLKDSAGIAQNAHSIVLIDIHGRDEKMLSSLTRLLLFGSTPVDSGVVMVTTIRQCGHRE